eukprot:Opistho-1_new@94418
MEEVLERISWPLSSMDASVSTKSVSWPSLKIQRFNKGVELVDVQFRLGCGHQVVYSAKDKSPALLVVPHGKPMHARIRIVAKKPTPGPLFIVKCQSLRDAQAAVQAARPGSETTDRVVQLTPDYPWVEGESTSACISNGPHVLEDAAVQEALSEFVIELERNERGELAPAMVHEYFHLPPRMFKQFEQTGLLVVRGSFFVLDGNGTPYQRVAMSFAITRHQGPLPAVHAYKCLFKGAKLLAQGHSMSEIVAMRGHLGKCSASVRTDQAVPFDRLAFLKMVERERKVSYRAENRPIWKSHFMAALAYRDANVAPAAAAVLDKRRTAGVPDDDVTEVDEEPAPDVAAVAAVRMSGRSKASVVRSVLLDVATTKMLEGEADSDVLGPEPDPQFLEAFDGVRLAYRVHEPQRSENGGRIVNAVLLGGLGGTTRRKELLGRGLRRFGVRSFVLDYRGHGSSGGEPGKAPTPDAFLRDVRTLVRHVTWNHPNDATVLVGHGLGANIAINYAQWKSRAPVSGYAFISPLLPFSIRREGRVCKCRFRCHCARNMQLTADSSATALEESKTGAALPVAEGVRHAAVRSSKVDACEARTVRFGESVALGLLLRLNRVSYGRIAGEAVALDVRKGMEKVEERVREARDSLRRNSLVSSASVESKAKGSSVRDNASVGEREQETDGSVRSKNSVSQAPPDLASIVDSASLGENSASPAGPSASAPGSVAGIPPPVSRESSSTTLGEPSPPADVLPPSVPEQLTINVVQCAIVRNSRTVFERIDRPFGLWVGENDEFIAPNILFAAAERSANERAVEAVPHADHLGVLADADVYVGPFLRANFSVAVAAN